MAAFSNAAFDVNAFSNAAFSISGGAGGAPTPFRPANIRCVPLNGEGFKSVCFNVNITVTPDLRGENLAGVYFDND